MNKKIPTFYALCFILFAIFCIIMVSVFFRLNPTKSVMTENKTEPIIVIDAGHGGEDGGAVSESGVLEKDINLSIANNSADLLKIFGYKVVQTRTDDVSLDNGEDSVHSRKVADLKKRLEIFNSDKNNIVFIKTNFLKANITELKFFIPRITVKVKILRNALEIP